MPVLTAILSSGFGATVAFLSAYVSKKVAVGVALTAFVVSGWVSLQLLIYGLYVSLGFAMPSAMADALKLTAAFLPANTFPIITALIAAKIAKWLWSVQNEHANNLAKLT